MLSPKFIIEDDFLILSKVIYHRHLVTKKENVKGGGWFRFQPKTNTFVFYGSSYDFGKAKMEDIKKCIKDKKIFTNKMQRHDISQKYTFIYDIGSELIKLN